MAWIDILSGPRLTYRNQDNKQNLDHPPAVFSDYLKTLIGGVQRGEASGACPESFEGVGALGVSPRTFFIPLPVLEGGHRG